jgi:capsular polysaccharide export protein
MEDGFIHSATLGRDSMALSLVLDKEGIYFDASRPSCLERLLNEHDFEKDTRLMQGARALRELMCELRVSERNLDSLRSPVNLLGPRLKRRVLVVGQVEEEASIRFGLAEGWTDHRLIALARAENPGADIIYKPHPDEVQGFRCNSAALEELQEHCFVLKDNVVLADLFREVDHVYTITSLSGFEALMKGLPVTVVGAPFYAGWGLTDDRTPLPRRTRRLSLDELFCGVYLLYPDYLTNLDEPVRGCLASILRVVADRRQHGKNLITPKILSRRANWIAESDQWPVLLKPENLPAMTQQYGKKIFSILSIPAIFARCSGEHYQRTMAYLLAGKFRESPAFPKLLDMLRTCMRPQHFAALLADIWRVAPSPVLLSHWVWLAEKEGDTERARESLTYLAGNGDYSKDSQNGTTFPIKKYSQVLAFAQFELRQKNFEEAGRLFHQLLLSGHLHGDVIVGLVEIARLRFDFVSAAELLKMFNHYDPAWKAGRGHLLEAQAHSLAGHAAAALESMALACRINPQFVESFATIEDVLGRAFGELPYTDAMLAANEVDECCSPIARAKALIASGQAVGAERLLLEYTPRPAETMKYCLMLSLAYSYQGKLEEAKALVVNLLPRYPTVLLYREGLRLAVLKNDYTWGKSLLDEATARDIEVGDIYHRKVALGLADIKGSYLSFRNMRVTTILKSYLGERYVQSLPELSAAAPATTAVIACFGPGDEIRFASFYREMRANCGSGRVMFTCDPRLHGLLKRHYTELEFVPSARIRSLAWLTDFRQHNQLPGSDLHTFFDNAGWELVKGAEKVILTTDALGDVIEDYSSFSGTPYLKADPERIAAWRRRLSDFAGKPIVGLSWRSSLTTYSRNEHYLAVEDLVPLFEVENAQFINLQYDECSEELAWLEERFPGRVVNFPDLDQYNDLEGVAALMSCLDLVVAPATTVAELAGALGRPTLFLSNSSELHWRKLPGTKTDVWHRSLTHIEGEILGDKQSLVRALAFALCQDTLVYKESEAANG